MHECKLNEPTKSKMMTETYLTNACSEKSDFAKNHDYNFI